MGRINKRMERIANSFIDFCRVFLSLKQESNAMKCYHVLKQNILVKLLHAAVECGSLYLVDELLKENVTQSTNASENPLLMAVYTCNFDMVYKLCKYPCFIDNKCIFEAAYQNSLILNILLMTGVQPKLLAFPPDTPASSLRLLFQAGFFLKEEAMCHSRMLQLWKSLSSLLTVSAFFVRKALTSAGRNGLSSAEDLGLPLELESVLTKPYCQDIHDFFCEQICMERDFEATFKQ